MRTAYIAAPIFTPHQLKVVESIKSILDLHGFEYFSPYDASREIWKGRAPADCEQWERDKVLRGNIDNLRTNHLLIAWVGGNPHLSASADTGVVWEMGYFRALGLHSRVPRFTLAYIHPNDARQHMNLMLAGTVDAVAYGSAELSRAVNLLGRGQLAQARVGFHPDKHLLHEREPIV